MTVEWLTTREVARIVAITDLKYLRYRLRKLRVSERRLGRLGRVRWSLADIERAFHETHPGVTGEKRGVRELSAAR